MCARFISVLNLFALIDDITVNILSLQLPLPVDALLKAELDKNTTSRLAVWHQDEFEFRSRNYSHVTDKYDRVFWMGDLNYRVNTHRRMADSVSSKWIIPHDITSHHITSHHITSHHITSHRSSRKVYMKYCLPMISCCVNAHTNVFLSATTRHPSTLHPLSRLIPYTIAFQSRAVVRKLRRIFDIWPNQRLHIHNDRIRTVLYLRPTTLINNHKN